MITRLAAALTGLVLIAPPLALSDTRAIAPLAAVAAIGLAAALVLRRQLLVTLVAAAILAEHAVAAVAFSGERALPPAVVGVLVLLLVETMDLASAGRGAVEPGVRWRRWRDLAGACTLGLGVATGAQILEATVPSSGPVAVVVSGTCAAAALALIVILARHALEPR